MVPAQNPELAAEEIEDRAAELESENARLRRRVAECCDQLVALPLRGRIASLNVNAAAAALLYEVLHRREGLDSAP